MAKFCGNCGKQVEEGAKVCGNCSTPIASENSGNTAIPTIPGVDYVDPEKKAKNKKLIKMVLGAVALIVVLVIAINIISGFVGYKGVVRKTMNAYKNYNIDALVDISSDFFLTYGDVEYYFEGQISSDHDYFEDRVGHKYNITYEITDSYTLSDRKFSELIYELSYYDDFDTDVISDARVVTLEVTAKDGKKIATLSKELILTKEAGSWKLLEMN